MRTRLMTWLAVAALGLLPGTASAAIIFSDSFEAPANSRDWQVYQTFGAWTATAGAGIEVQTNGAVGGIASPFGTQYVELDSDNSRGGIKHAGTNSTMTRTEVLGWGHYELSFWYLPRTGTLLDNVIEALVDGTTIGLISASRSAMTDWTRIAFSFSIDDGPAPHAIGFRAAGIQNTLGGLVDMVELRRVPEPGSLALTGLGLAALAALGATGPRRRRKG